MGVKGLPKFVKTYAGSYAVGTYDFLRFKGMTVAVDASLLINQTGIAMRSSGKDMKNKQGQVTSHLYGIFYKVLIFLENGMTPIFIFDGKAPDIKNKTIGERNKRKADAIEKIEQLTEDSEDENYIRLFKKTYKPTKADIDETFILLELMGIPYIVAPGEADVICSWLASRYDNNGQRYAKGVCSDDSDMLALGARYLFKDMLRFRTKNKKVTVISLHRTLVKTNLSMKQFTDLCVLLGCDYCDNIKGIGPKNAYDLISKYKSLENVLKHLDDKFGYSTDNGDTSDNSDNSSDSKNDDTNAKKEYIAKKKCLIDARNYFCNALTDIDNSDDFILTDDNLKCRMYQYEELIDFLCVKHDFDILRVQTGMKRLEAYYKKMKITRPNTAKVHKILQPRAENYIFRALTEDINFIPSDEDNEDIEQKEIIKPDDIPSKKTKNKDIINNKIIPNKSKNIK